MSENKFNFTDSKLRKLTNQTGKKIYFYDSICYGLQICLTTNNTISFRLNAWDASRKKPVVVTIGRYPKIGINTARDIAREHVQQIAAGKDIKRGLTETNLELTLDRLFEKWLEYAKENKKTWKEDESKYNLYIKKYLGKKKISAIKESDIKAWRRKVLDQKKIRGKNSGDCISKTTVNRAFGIVRSMYNRFASDLPNPCKDIPKYHEKKRKVFLRSDHLRAFFKTLDNKKTPEYLKDMLLIFLYTGARRANVLSMQWKDVDLSLKFWIIPEVKSENDQEELVIPLIDGAVEILEKRKKRTKSVFVFPSEKSKTGHIVEPKRAWKSFLKNAGLPTDYRLHDLRRTQGSWQAISGISGDIIGKALGHKSRDATAHYIHLTLSPVRNAMQQAVDAMEKEVSLPDKVVKIKNG